MAKFLDVNKDGKFTKEDVDGLLAKAGKKGQGFIPKTMGKLLFKALDKNGDGQLDGDEAFGLFKHKNSQKNCEQDSPVGTNEEDQYYPEPQPSPPKPKNNNKYY